MIRHIFSIFLCLFNLVGWAQQTVTAHVVNNETGEALPYVTVYVSPGKGTMSNEEGDFRISVEDDETICLSCIGYKSLRLDVRNVPSVIRMSPMVRELQELTVMPAPVQLALSKAIKLLDKEAKSYAKKEGMYFYRTVISDSVNNELVEAFIRTGSAINLHNLCVLSGIRGLDGAGGESELGMKSTNMHLLSEIGPTTIGSYRWLKTVKPLEKMSTTRKFYTYSGASLTGEDGQRIYKIDLDFNGKLPSSKKDWHILSGTVFIDSATCQLLRFDGEVTNIYQRVLHKNVFVRAPTEMKVHIEYDHSDGVTEVSHLSILGGNKNMQFRSLAFKVKEREIVMEKGIQMGGNMMDAIEDVGDNSPLWDEYEVVKRTAQEEQIAFGYSSNLTRARMREFFKPDTVHTDNPRLRQLCDQLYHFGTQTPQEKVYIHMDNTCYFQGDTIWFTAYTRSTEYDAPSVVSGLLYVELLNQDGFLVERKQIQMRNGHGYGNFVLDQLVQYSGFYELRAYTRWQLNWGLHEHEHSREAKRWFLSKELEHNYYRDYDKLYSRVFPVYDKRADSVQFNRNMTMRPMRRYFAKDPEPNKLTLALYPEGGNLVAGVPCRVAYEALWSDGEWAKGTLQVGKESYPVVNRGRGVFIVTPEKGMEREVIFVTPDGDKVKEKLPKPQEEGVALKVDWLDGSLAIRIGVAGQLALSSLGMTVMHEGVLEVFRPLSEKNSQIQIPSSSLREGVNQVTVFDETGRVWADRLVFVSRRGFGEPTLLVLGSKKEYNPYERIELSVSAPSMHKGTARSWTSIAVRDKFYTDHLFDNGSILTEMLLSSEIRGFVPQPGWFFEQDDKEHRQALDLLMMTQGWRRFDWHEMAVKDAFMMTQPREKTQILQGRVYNISFIEEKLKTTFIEANQNALEMYNPYDRQTNDPSRNSESSAQEKEQEEKSASQEKQSDYDRTGPLTPDGFNAREMASDPRKEVTLNMEMVNLSTNIPVKERLMTLGNRFEKVLPRTFSPHVLYIDIYRDKDFKRDLKKARKSKEALVLEDEDKPCMLCIDHPYPRFTNPYTYYQTHLSQLPDDDPMAPILLGDTIHQLREVPVRARFGGLRKLDESQPALLLGDLEAENLMTDAGIVLPGIDRLGRTLFGDLGFDYPYALSTPMMDLEGNTDRSRPESRIRARYGISPTRRAIEGLDNISRDSTYAPQYLKSYTADFFLKSMSNEERKQYMGVGAIEKYVVYTDYSPRMEGNRRYRGTNLPDIYIAQYPYPDHSRHMVFADRCIPISGFSYPTDFYSPDYSKQTPPEPTDYRRTLYWNPSLKLDENGQARITFYNNSRTTQICVEAEGQASDGTLLWSK